MTGKAIRSLGYRILGRQFDYLLHLRPMEWPIVTIHMLVGYGLAVGRVGVGGTTSGRMVLLGVVAWIVCLNGGTLAINSAFDRDEGDVAYLRNPPPPPGGLFPFGVALMAFGAGLVWNLPAGYRVAYWGSVVLSVLYSVPPFRWKRIAGIDWIINIVGFGLLTPYAGYALAGGGMEPAAGLTIVGFGILFGALYPLTQLYQMNDDRARGDRTFALVLGRQGSLTVSIWGVLLAWVLFLSAAGPQLWTRSAWVTMALTASLGAWLGILLPWFLQAGDWSDRRQQLGMYHALAAWALTDAAMVVVWMV